MNTKSYYFKDIHYKNAKNYNIIHAYIGRNSVSCIEQNQLLMSPLNKSRGKVNQYFLNNYLCYKYS